MISTESPFTLKEFEATWRAYPDGRLGLVIVNSGNRNGRLDVCPEIFYVEERTCSDGSLIFAEGIYFHLARG